MVLKISDRASGRDNNFNLIRMIAATSVLLSHAYPLAVGADALEPFEKILTQDHMHDNLGRVAVFAFFGISGFFITKSFCQKTSLREFVRARVFRLFPALVPMSILTFLAVAWLGMSAPFLETARVFPEYFAAILTLSFPKMLGVANLSSDIPGAFVGNPMTAVNGSLWTLPFEVMCYTLVALAGGLGLLRRTAFFLPSLALVLAAYFIVFQFFPDRDHRLELLLYLGLPFAIGASFWVLRDRVPLSPVLTIILVILTVFSSGTILFRPIFCLALVHGIFVLGYARIPLIGAYNKVGDYSYGIYIYAFPVQQLLVFHGFTGAERNILAALPVTLFLAILSWHVVEKPMLRLAHRKRGPRV